MLALAGLAVLTLGCLAWLCLAVVGWRTLRAIPLLAAQAPAARERWPTVSIVSPACDEADTLEAASRARLESDLPGLELVLVDDRSRDGTGAVVDRLAAADPRVRAVHVHELPEGWLGKVWAMEQGLRAARGEWILFSDADVHLAPDALRRALDLCEARGLDALAVLPQIRPATLPCDAAISAFGRAFVAGVRPWAVEDPRSDASCGVGAFHLVRRTALQRAGGLQRIRLEVADDLALGALLKRSGARCGVANGRGTVALHWDRTVGQMARGLETGSYAHAGRCDPWRLVFAGMILLFFEWAPWAAALLPHGAAWLHVLGATTIVLSLAVAVRGERWAGRRAGPVLLQPLGGLLMALFIWRAAWCGWRRGGVEWRGTFYPSGLLREAMAWGKGGWRGDARRE